MGITLILDIPFVRQVLGFFYLTFLIGYVLIRAFGLETSDKLDTLLFSVGLSISFLMFLGLINNSFGLFGIISRPLSTELLFITISLSFIVISLYGCLKNPDSNAFFSTKLKISNLVLYIAFPLLSTIAIMLIKVYNNNLLLLLVIILMSISFFFNILSKSSSHYPFFLASIALSLLLITFLVSNYLNGFDVHYEYINFNITNDAAYWYPKIGQETFMRYHGFPIFISQSMLSDTILPTIFTRILNIEVTSIFNIIYPLIFSLTPLCLYQLFKRTWSGNRIAFLSVLFVICNSSFFDFRNNARQMIAELFFVLLFYVLLSKEMKPGNKWILLIFFSFGLIVSYYLLAYVFLFLIIFTWVLLKIINKNYVSKIKFEFIAFFSVLSFCYYIYIAEGGFARFLLFISGVYNNLITEFFNYQSRGSAIVSATNILNAPSVLHQIGTLLFDATTFLILVGFVVMIIRRKIKRSDQEYTLLASLSMATLMMAVILPNFAYTIQMGKLYHIALLFISPLFVLGGKTIFSYVLKFFPLKEKKKKTCTFFLIMTLLVAFFLFQTGFVYEVMDDPTPSSISLSKYRMDELTRIELAVLDESNVYGAFWLAEYLGVNNGQIYSDIGSKYRVLISYMMDVNNTINLISNNTVFEPNSYVYLSGYNTLTGVLTYDMRFTKEVNYNMTDFLVFDNKTSLNNRIYSNGACEIYHFNTSRAILSK